MNAPEDRQSLASRAIGASGSLSGTTTSEILIIRDEDLTDDGRDSGGNASATDSASRAAAPTTGADPAGVPTTSNGSAGTGASRAGTPATGTAAAGSSAPREFSGLDREGRMVFLGLMLGMFVASISQTIVGPALPRIVAELNGMEHYSWVATSAMLVSAVTVPIVGKFSDIYGRRGFYIAGLAIFLLGAILAGFAQSFWFLVFARAVQGAGMGTLMPLSQTIIGDIIPPRQRGKYQGIMGAVFGVSSIAGPLLGGLVTDAFGWRWLFFMTLPLGVIALAFIGRYLHLEHTPRTGAIDHLGMATLVPGLVLLLLATTWGGNQYAWGSATIIGMYAVSAVLLTAFVLIERRAENPLIPMSIFTNSVVTLSVVASFLIAVAMFGAIIYIPVFAQAVLGVSATNSGAILIPLNLAMVSASILMGLLITKIGRYKEVLIGGAAIMLVGYILLAQLNWQSSTWALTGTMLVFGIGLGMSMQTYTLVVQNAIPQSELGVATASVQFFRNVGSTVGIAILGSVMSARTEPAIAARMAALPPAVKQKIAESAAASPGSSADGLTSGAESNAILDANATAQMPQPVVDAIRSGMGDAMHDVFVTAIPFVVAALIVALFIKQLKLRTTL